MATTDPRPEPLDFRRAIICALPREFDAVEALFDEGYDNLPMRKQHADPNFYRTGRIGTDYIVLTCLADMGKGSAASTASTLRISFPNIDLALVVGICGGVPFPTEKTELILGDVIISNQVVKFDFGRQYPDRFEQKGSMFQTLDCSHREIRCLLSGLQTRREQERFQDLHVEYVRSLAVKDPRWGYPGVDRDELFPSSSQHVNDGNTSSVSDCRSVGCQGVLVQRLRLNTQGTPRPRVFFGPMASGDTVMRSAEHRDRLARKSGVFGFEMEGGGVCDTLSCLIIKGACDYADSHKNKIWQDYAAASSAACAKALLEFMLESKAEYGAYTYSQCLQTHTGGISASITSQSPADTLDPDEHIKSIRKALDRLGDNIPSTMMRRALLPAATDMIDYSESRVRNLQETEIFQSEPRETMFGTIRFHTQIIKHHGIFDDEQKTQTETQTSFNFHPAPWLMRLGLRYGLKVMAINHHRTWRYTIQPVHAIPDDSLIFTFCKSGNVDAIRELFKRGYACVIDVDTHGHTPLHIAVYWGHFELAKLLISEGADRRAYTYGLTSVSIIQGISVV
ncbi:nucleoside phosphorylase domain-containing protein [Aspergillus californicus]